MTDNDNSSDNSSDSQDRSILNYAAIKTAIVNGEADNLDELLGEQPMQSLEKDYLIDLAKMNNNTQIIERLERIPSKED